MESILNSAAKDLLEGDALAHLVTLNKDHSAQLSAGHGQRSPFAVARRPS